MQCASKTALTSRTRCTQCVPKSWPTFPGHRRSCSPRSQMRREGSAPLARSTKARHVSKQRRGGRLPPTTLRGKGRQPLHFITAAAGDLRLPYFIVSTIDDRHHATQLLRFRAETRAIGENKPEFGLQLAACFRLQYRR